MKPVAQLVAQIREALSKNGSQPQAEGLAREFARLTGGAAQRLESCVAMLEKGSEYQALQLAETAPSLLELIVALNFPEAASWSEFCAARRFPLPATFNSKSVHAL